MANRVVTITIDSTAVKLMEAEDGKVMKWASLSLEPTMIQAGAVTAPPVLGSALRQLMASSGIKGTKNVVASISGLYSVSRILTVPNPPPGSTLSEAVRQAVEEAVSLKVEELYLSWQTLAGAGQRALVLGVPREVIDTEVQALRAAKLNPRILDFKPIALARAVNKEQALILNIETASFDIIIVADGIPEVTRVVLWSPQDLSPEDRAEQLALNLGWVVSFYNSRHPDLPLDLATPLVVTGDLSEDSALVESLQDRTGYPLEPLLPPLECPAHLPIAQYAVNIGLSLRGMAPAKNPGESDYLLPGLNLLPAIYLPWKPTRRQIVLSLAIIVGIGLLVPAYQVTADTMSQTAILKVRQGIINSQIENRQAEINSRQPLQQAVNEYQAIVKLGGGLTEDLRVVQSLAETLGVRLGTVSHLGDKISLSAESDNYTAFREYLAVLEESGRFATPIPPPEGYPYTKSGPIDLRPKAGG